MILNHFKTYKYAYIWAIMVTYLCGTNAKNIPHFDFKSEIGIDKIVHFILFGTETFLIAIASKKLRINSSNLSIIFPAFLIGTTFGIVIEILQGTVFVNRSFDYFDMLANTIGCGMAWGILSWKFRNKSIY